MEQWIGNLGDLKDTHTKTIQDLTKEVQQLKSKV